MNLMRRFDLVFDGVGGVGRFIEFTVKLFKLKFKLEFEFELDLEL